MTLEENIIFKKKNNTTEATLIQKSANRLLNWELKSIVLFSCLENHNTSKTNMPFQFTWGKPSK